LHWTESGLSCRIWPGAAGVMYLLRHGSTIFFCLFIDRPMDDLVELHESSGVPMGPDVQACASISLMRITPARRRSRAGRFQRWAAPKRSHFDDLFFELLFGRCRFDFRSNAPGLSRSSGLEIQFWVFALLDRGWTGSGVKFHSHSHSHSIPFFTGLQPVGSGRSDCGAHAGSLFCL